MRNITLILIGLGFLTLLGSGCATAGVNNKEQSKPNYEFMDAYEEYEIFERNNDLYLEKKDKSEIRRITNTPKIREVSAVTVNDGKDILYSVIEKKMINYAVTDPTRGTIVIIEGDKFYSQPLNGDDNNKEIIDWAKFFHYKYNIK